MKVLQAARPGEASHMERKINNHTTATSNTVIRPFLLIILVVSLGMAFRLLQPFINPIILAIVFAALFNPLHRRLLARFPRCENLIALSMVLLISVLIVLPFFIFLTALADQGIQLSASIKSWVQGGGLQNIEQNTYVEDVLAWLQRKIPFIQFEKIDLQGQFLTAAKLISESFLRHGAGMLGNLATTLTYFFVMMFIVFYLIRDGKGMIQRVKHLSPLREDQENRIFEKIAGVSRSVFLGSLLTAALQGLVGGIGMAIVGIPGLFWGTMLGFASLIPVVGTALIWVPITGYLILIGSYKSAIFFALWSALLVGSIDNFLRPFFMRGSTGMSPFWIFLAILGGVQIFGLAGMLYGPLILGFAMIMLLIYEEEFHIFLVEKDNAPAPQPCSSRSVRRRFALPLKGRSPHTVKTKS